MNRCEGCELSKLDITHRVCIPLPSDKIRGCLISRDPTSAFLDPLEKYQQLPLEQKGNLWLDAPPRWLCKKIGLLMDFDENSPELIKLRDFLNYECYWTHLHKCPTCKPIKKDSLNRLDDKKQCYPPFRYSTAKSCADRWFEIEFNEYGLKDKIIITLGRDVEKYFNQWSRQHLSEISNQVISLPHPSDANCGNVWSWNKNSEQKEFIVNAITRFLQLI